MIHPVKTVGETPWTAHHIVLHVPQHTRSYRAGPSRTLIARCALPLAWSEAYPTRLQQLRHALSWPQAVKGVCMSAPGSAATDFWQPWPAHEPFADEILRWWPSQEYPPLEPTPVIEDKQPDRIPDFVLWPAYGGLLDTWA